MTGPPRGARRTSRRRSSETATSTTRPAQGGGALVRITVNREQVTAEPVYHERRLPGANGGSVLIDGNLYGTNSAGLLCVDFMTGAVKWQDRSIGTASIVYVDGRLYLHGEEGAVALIEPTPAGYREKGRFTPPGLPERGAGEGVAASGGGQWPPLYPRPRHALELRHQRLTVTSGEAENVIIRHGNDSGRDPGIHECAFDGGAGFRLDVERSPGGGGRRHRDRRVRAVLRYARFDPKGRQPPRQPAGGVRDRRTRRGRGTDGSIRRRGGRANRPGTRRPENAVLRAISRRAPNGRRGQA